jgi:hypothetical protein
MGARPLSDGSKTRFTEREPKSTHPDDHKYHDVENGIDRMSGRRFTHCRTCRIDLDPMMYRYYDGFAFEAGMS